MNILISGASRGLGLALVKKFAEDTGNTVIAVSRSLEKLNEFLLQGQPGRMSFSTVIPYSFDLVSGDYRELSDFVSMHISKLDILVNSAGFLVRKPFLQTSEQDFDTIFNTNVRAVYRTIQALYPLFDKGSHIVNIASMSGFQGSVKFPGLSAYSASKAAVAGLTESLATEFQQQGISVNALALGSVQTEMFSEAFPGYEAAVTPEKMAEFVADFARTGHQYFNGKILPVAVSTP